MIDWFRLGFCDAVRGRLPRDLFNQNLTPTMKDNYAQGYNHGVDQRIPRKYR